MKKKSILIITVILSIVLGVVSSAGINKVADITKGKSESLLVNRVNMTVNNTEFSFKNVQKGDLLTCTFDFSIEKSEPEFYGLLNSLTLSGYNFTSVLYYAGENNGTANFPVNTPVPSHNGKTEALEWEVSFSFIYDGETQTYLIPLTVDYTSGIEQNLAQRYITDIPLTVNISN